MHSIDNTALITFWVSVKEWEVLLVVCNQQFLIAKGQRSWVRSYKVAGFPLSFMKKMLQSIAKRKWVLCEPERVALIEDRKAPPCVSAKRDLVRIVTLGLYHNRQWRWVDTTGLWEYVENRWQRWLWVFQWVFLRVHRFMGYARGNAWKVGSCYRPEPHVDGWTMHISTWRPSDCPIGPWAKSWWCCRGWRHVRLRIHASFRNINQTSHEFSRCKSTYLYGATLICGKRYCTVHLNTIAVRQQWFITS